jgi:uncharacterized membrane protein YgcG
MRMTKTLTSAMLLASVATCTAQPVAAQTFPDRGRAAVVDAANVIPDDRERALNDRVVAWSRHTGHQLAIVTVPTLQGYDIKDYGYRLGRAWGLGDAKRNDGAVLLLAPTERKVRIEVGYGLESVLTDALTTGIIHDEIVPRLKQGDVASALTSGADDIMGAATEPVAANSSPAEHHGSGWIVWVLLGLGAGATVVTLWVRRRRRKEVAAIPLVYGKWKDDPVPKSPHYNKTTGTAHDIPRPRRAPGASLYTAPPPRRTYDSTLAAVYVMPSSPPAPAPSPSYSSYDSSPSPSPTPSPSSDSGYDSGGGSFGGGGSDSSY